MSLGTDGMMFSVLKTNPFAYFASHMYLQNKLATVLGRAFAAEKLPGEAHTVVLQFAAGKSCFNSTCLPASICPASLSRIKIPVQKKSFSFQTTLDEHSCI